MKRPPRSLRSLPPAGGRSVPFGRPGGYWDERPPRSVRSLPPAGGRSVPFGRPGGY
jgi:hypothetical protein